MVIEDILLFIIALTCIDERIVHIPIFITQTNDSRARVPRDIGYLMLVIRIAGVRHIASILVGILSTESCGNTATPTMKKAIPQTSAGFGMAFLLMMEIISRPYR